MPEIPKRLALTRDTLRELYLKSGNRCAFPKCNKSLFKSNGVFVGQICHIEAAEPGGERFNINQTNEQRRHPSNLVLMCYDHHKETNDVVKFPTKTMKEIKQKHERLFSDVVESMLKTVTDHTTLKEPLFAKNLRKLSRVLGWKLVEKDLVDSTDELKKITSRLAMIPLPSRQLFSILINRAKKDKTSDTLEVSVPEVEQATNLESGELHKCFSILDDHGFTHDGGINEFGVQMVSIPWSSTDWDVWGDIKRFCKKDNVDLSQTIINLNFSILDES